MILGRLGGCLTWGVMLLSSVAVACGVGEQEFLPREEAVSAQPEGTEHADTVTQSKDAPVVEVQAAPLEAAHGEAKQDAKGTKDEAKQDQAGAKIQAAPSKSLEDLLRLSDSTRAQLGSKAKPSAATPRPSAEADARRLQLEIDSRSETAVIQPARSRTTTDARVSVDMGNDTKLRGGVRVEQESDSELGKPLPTIGIEKRF